MRETKHTLSVARAWAVGIVALATVGCWFLTPMNGIAAEHELMENIQALCLLGGGVMLWLRARAVINTSTNHGLELTALGFITMFLLEYDVRPFKIAPHLAIKWTDQKHLAGRNLGVLHRARREAMARDS